MTKADLVTEISQTTGIERKETERVVECLMEVVKKSLVDGKKIQLRGFGSFETRERASKVGRDIHKKESVIIPKTIVPVFKPSKLFKALLLEENKPKSKNKKR